MAKSETIPKKKGQRAIGRDRLVALRLPPTLISKIEEWAGGQSSSLPRSEAIRRLIEKGLAGTQPAPRHSTKAAAHAREKASQTIDDIVDQSAPADEREKRKRRLLKGPEEFRDIRGDLPKSKG